jgi:endonuclease-3
MRWLTASRGVGKKTAGIVLLFSYDKPYFPVDTHIRRISTRLNLIDPRDDPHDRLNAVVPKDAERLRSWHLLLIRLGREICHPRFPECDRCPLAARCPARESIATGVPGKAKIA